MYVSFFRTLILYAVIVFGIRLMGKRQLGELQPTELVITIIISNIATLPLEEVDTPLFMGLVPIISLVACEVLMSLLSLSLIHIFHSIIALFESQYNVKTRFFTLKF